MAKLPSANDINRSVAEPYRKQAPDGRIQIADASPIGEAAARLGNVVAQAGGNLYQDQQMAAAEQRQMNKAIRIETDRLDTLRVEEAINQLKAREMEMTVGEKGYTTVKGAQAVERKTPLYNDYDKSFTDAMTEIQGTLHNENQRGKFKLRADSTAMGFRTNLLKHQSEQAEQYKDDVYTGTLSTVEKGMAVNWFNQANIDQGKIRVRDVIGQAFADKPDEFKQGKLLESYQKINGSVVSSALGAGQLGYAEEYMKKNIGQMSTDDILKYGGEIKKIKEDQVIGTVVEDVISRIPPLIAPTDSERLIGLVIKAGAPGANINPDGQMSSSDLKIATQDYLKTMLTNYQGDVNKALVAFHTEPKIVADAEKRAAKEGGTWADYVPPETASYVDGVTKSFSAGDNALPQPTLLDIKNEIKLRMAGAPPEVVDKALTKAETQFNDIRTDQDQKAENVLTDIMAAVDAGKVTKYSDLTPDQLTLLGTKRTAARSYIESGNKADQNLATLSVVATEFYYDLYTDPVALRSTPIEKLMAMAPDIGQQRVNALLQKRAEYISKPEIEKAATLDADQFKANALKFGFNINNAATKKELILIEDRVKAEITDLQNDKKRTLTREEKDTITKRMMTEFPQVAVKRKGRLEIFGGENDTIPKRGYQVVNPANIIVPDDIKARIMAAYKAKGLNPTESQMRNDYAAYLAAQKEKQ
jgi:hypothetical protein